MKYIQNFLFVLCCCLLSGSLVAQVNIQVNITELTVDVGDCDNVPFDVTGDSDPTWWFFDGGGSGLDIDDQCQGESANGGTFATNQNLWDETYGCIADIPTSFTFTFGACEDDGAGCAAGSAVGVGCDGPRTLTDIDLGALPTTAGTIAFGPFCHVSDCGSGAGNYCFSGEIVVTGALPPVVADNICAPIQVPLEVVPNQFSWCGSQTLEADEAPISAVNLGSEDGSAWFSFTAPPSGDVFIDSYTNSFLDNCSILGCGNEFTVYHASNGTDCTGNNICDGTELKNKFDYLTYWDNAEFGGPGNVSFYADANVDCLIPGDTYYIQYSVDDVGSTGTIGMEITDNNPVGNQVTYDVPCTAFDADPFVDQTQNQDGLTPEEFDVLTACAFDNEFVDIPASVPPHPADPTTSTLESSTVWMSFTAPASGRIYVETNCPNQGEQAALYSYDPTFGPACPTDYSCADIVGVADDPIQGTAFGDGGSILGETAVFEYNCLEPGYTYYVVLDEPDLGICDMDVWIYDPSGVDAANNNPGNDIMCQALADAQYEVPVNLDGACGATSANGNSSLACIESLAGEPSGGGQDQTTWHYFTVPASGSVEIIVSGDGHNFNVYETSDGTTAGCFGGLSAACDSWCQQPAACATGSTAGGAITKCCLTPGDVLAIQLDAQAVADGVNLQNYNIEINEITIDAGAVSYTDPDGDGVDSTTPVPTTAAPSLFCNGETLTPASDAVQCANGDYCAVEAACDFPTCLGIGYALHDTPAPADLASVGTIYATIDPTGTSFPNDGSLAGVPTCTVVYVSPIADDDDAGSPAAWGDFCASAAVGDAAPVVFLAPIALDGAVNVDADCNVSFTMQGGLPCFDAAQEYSYTGDNGLAAGTSTGGVISFTAPAAMMYTVTVTDGEGCTFDVPVDATTCTAAAVCDITAIDFDANTDITCSGDNTTYTVSVTVTGSDASVTLEDPNSTELSQAANAGVITFTYNSGTAYSISVVDSDNLCDGTFADIASAGVITCPLNDACGITAVDFDPTTDITCSADNATYTVSVGVTGTDASVTLDDPGSVELSQAAAGTVVFTYNSGTAYNISVVDADNLCDGTFADIASAGAITCPVIPCDINNITVDEASIVCAADGLTYTIDAVVTGADASVTLSDAGSVEGNQPAAGTVTFTYNAGTNYNITVVDTDNSCNVSFGPYTGATAPVCEEPLGIDLAASDPCNCGLGIDLNTDITDGLELAQETIVFSGGSGTYTVTDTDGALVDATGTPYTVQQLNTLLGAGNTIVAYVLADGISTYAIDFADGGNAANTSSISGGMCSPCPVNIPTVGQWGLIILGLLMSITAVVGIRQRREEEIYA